MAQPRIRTAVSTRVLAVGVLIVASWLGTAPSAAATVPPTDPPSETSPDSLPEEPSETSPQSLPEAPSETMPGSPADLLGCAEQVFDPAGVTSSALADTAAQVADQLDADLHVRVEGSLDGDIDARQLRLETECEGWLEADGLRASNLLVVMVSPSERSSSIFFGENYEDALDVADAPIQEYVMNPRFKEDAFEQGLIDGLNAIKAAVEGGEPPQGPAPIFDGSDFTYPASRSASSSSSSSGNDGLPAAGLIGLIVLVLLVLVFSTWAKNNGWATTDDSSGYRRSWSSSSSRRSSSRSSRSSSSRRSSRSSSRRSGGGGSSSRW